MTKVVMNTTMNTSIFDANKLATTVGANSFAAGAVVSQPRICIPVEEVVEYEFDQLKFEEYLSSSSRSSASRKRRKINTPVVAVAEPCNAPSASNESGSADLNSSSIKELSTEGAPILSERARQRQRQRCARQLARALESIDGIRYEADLKIRQRQAPQQRTYVLPSKPVVNEWVQIKRIRSTLEERIKKRRTLLAHARILAQKAKRLQREEVEKKPQKLHKVWRPKSKTATEKIENRGSLESDPPARGSLGSDLPKHRSLQSDPPLCRSLGSDLPNRRSLGSDLPKRRSLQSDPPLCRSLGSDLPNRRSLGSDLPKRRSLQSDPPLCRSLGSDLPNRRSLGSDLPKRRSLQSDLPNRRSLGSDLPKCSSLQSDPPLCGSLGSDPPLRGSLESDPPTRRSLKSDPRQGRDKRHSAPITLIPLSSVPLLEPHDNMDLSQFKVTIVDRLGPLHEDRGKVLTEGHLGPVTEPRATRRAGGRTRPLNNNKPSYKGKTPVSTRLGVCVQNQEPVEILRSQKRSSKHVTLENAHKAANPLKETYSSDDDNVIPGESCQHTIGCSGHLTDELYYRAGGMGESRKRYARETKSHCPCAELIMAVLSACSCPKTAPQKVSISERTSNGMTKSKPKSLRKKRSVVQGDEFPEVTINMADKGKSIRPSSSDPLVSHRLARLRVGTTRRKDYQRMQRGLSSDDEASDANSAIASDSTVSSPGQSREVFMINTEQIAKILEDALTKQKEAFKFEMETAMRRMREEHDQQIRALSNQLGESSRRNVANQAASDSDADEHINADDPPVNQDTGGDSTKDNNAGGGSTEDDNAGGGRVIPLSNHPRPDTSEDEKMKDLESKINALMSAQEVKRTGIPCPYPREWDSISYPAKFNLINFTPFDGKGSPTQHLIYFKSHLGMISGNEALMVRSFVGTLRGPAFDWYRRLKPGSINNWDDMESSFLGSFFDDDDEVSIRTLFDEKQEDDETVDDFVKRFRNKAMNCRDPITEDFILQTCHNNLSIEILEVMGVAPSNTWKDLKVRGEQAERFLRRRKAKRDQPTVNSPKSNFTSRGKEKAHAAVVDVNQTSQQQPRRQQKTSDPRLQKEYSFKDEDVPAIFESLLENNKIKLPPVINQEEADNTADPKYCAYHRRVLHPTKDCFALKNSIQTLVEAGVITLG